MMKYIFITLFAVGILACGQQTSAPAPTSGSGDLTGFELIAYPSSVAQKAMKKEASGNVLEEGDVVDGVRQGAWLSYHTGRNAGIVKSISNYFNGNFQGPHLTFDNVGRLEKKSFYANNQLHGPYVEYKFGKPIKEANYVNGQLDGKYTTYYQNGKKQQETDYSMGKKNGKSIFYNEEEQVTLEYEFKNGVQLNK